VRESDSPTPSTFLNFSPSPAISTAIEGKLGPTTTVIIVRRPPSVLEDVVVAAVVGHGVVKLRLMEYLIFFDFF